MSVTRLRWGLGAAIALLALAAAGRALITYVDHRLWLGALTVLLLGAIDVGGFASLAAARRRLHRELRGLEAEPPVGELIAGRRKRLEQIARAGGTADLEALASASHAEETARAYLGRYLVAVTVLVGLVGTFAGLMETLRTVAPLIRDEKLPALELLAAPLAGLDVTFGASIVGILVTLALTLIQGDLVLAEELTLARLEERTTHALVPPLWPPEDAPAERTVRELAALRAELAGFLGQAVEATGARVAAVTAREVERLVREVKEALSSTVAEAVGASREVTGGLLAVSAQVGGSIAGAEARVSQTLISAAERMNESLSQAAKEVLADVARATTALVAALDRGGAEAARAQTRLLDETRARHDQLATAAADSTRRVEAALGQAAERHDAALSATTAALLGTVGQAADRHGAALGATTAALLSTVGSVVGESGARLAAASSTLADAAGALRGGAEALAPSVATLAPEMAALARELALLASRVEAAEERSVVLDELVRLGDGVDRLESLLRLSAEGA